MEASVSILIPFDLGFELAFDREEHPRVARELSCTTTEPVSFQGAVFAAGQARTQIYKFGVGLLELSFTLEGTLPKLASIANSVTQIFVGSTPITEWASAFVHDFLSSARPLAQYEYEQRLEELDFLPIFSLPPDTVLDADAFLEKNYKALYGIVSAEPNYDLLSRFVITKEKLENLGYYENELILIKRFGAIIASGEAQIILDIFRLTYALYWMLRSYNFILDAEINQAQSLLSDLPPWYKFWTMPKRYETFSTEGIDFVRDKLAIVDSIHQVLSKTIQIDSDWHLRTIYRHIESEFDIPDLVRAVDKKLDRIDEAYKSAREFIATNFFIAVEMILILSFAWMVLDTALLFVIAGK
ncbi:hypothetical protein [Candidatus Methylacidithermus pantelleriae]|uniref:DUF155 domain-containing protein n=1 Tax=Candidatus Methylacidithermus pantelleriae TaxID=2744239 RepID=A0A8J2BM92_9BACT|nr:hypothetical protein [Candidatus Methylacidithermus pantelleriae]CAF0691483.1 conserved hypothetical protein [Candidatus Methylacidithermus pantelleriae]